MYRSVQSAVQRSRARRVHGVHPMRQLRKKELAEKGKQLLKLFFKMKKD